VAAVGDLMCHRWMVSDAYDRDTKTYNFVPMLADIAPLLIEADIAVGNLETPVAGSEFGYTGSSSLLNFNAPDSYLDMLKSAGFDVLTNANNHILDKRWQGILNTLDALDEWGFVHTGGFRNQEENETPCIVEHDGIRIAFVTGTGILNIGRGAIPKEFRQWAFNDLDIEKLSADIDRARQAGADLVFASMHWGSEGTQKPSSHQRRLAEELIAAGADCILGHHPHVLQPIEMVESGGRTGLVFYSLGNFISNMYPPQADTGAIAYITYEKNNETGEVTLKDAAYLPAIVWKKPYQGEGNWDFRVLPMQRYLEDEALFETLDRGMKKRMPASFEETVALLGEEPARLTKECPD
jgi:poly-gamma-glutamate capsule biosynthesis protein CapA/YwtB (metallophosphatase superfamily)